jgi:hypothetical protein
MSVQTSHFPEVLAEVQQAIEVLGGTIIPKLNWSCPKVCRLNKHLAVVLHCLLKALSVSDVRTK